MKGSGKDENKRAPMYWCADPEGEGMCEAPPDMDEVKMKYPPLDEQEEDPGSICNYVKNAIRIRKEYPAVARGKTMMPRGLGGDDVCALLRTAPGEESALLLINTSDEEQQVELTTNTRRFNVLADMLCTGEEQPSLQDGRVTLPPFGIAVLTAE